MIQKTKVKEAFHHQGRQITAGGITAIDDWVTNQIKRMTERAKMAEIKRFTPDSLNLVSNRFDKVLEEIHQPKEECKRCTGLHDRYLRNAWENQRFVKEEIGRYNGQNNKTGT